MIETILVFGILSLFFFGAYQITGAIFKALIWLVILVPIAIVIWAIGLACCCTLILIPVGLKLFVAGCKVLLPV